MEQIRFGDACKLCGRPNIEHGNGHCPTTYMNRLATPTNEAAIEALLQAKALNAPRLSPEDLDRNIIHSTFVRHVSAGGQVLRWCVLTTKSGYAVTGRPSVAVSPENDDFEVGERIAFTNARNELWQLMGYALKEGLSKVRQPLN